MEADGLSVEEMVKGHHRECLFLSYQTSLKIAVLALSKKNEWCVRVCSHIMTVEYPLTN